MIQALLESAKGAWLEKSQLIHRIECQVEYIDFTALLHTVDDTEFSYYWQDRDSDYESLGLGSSDVHNGTDMATLGPLLDRLQQQLSGKGPRYRYLGGNRFNQESHQDPTWEPIYSFRYMLPLLEYCKHDGQYYLAMYYRLSDFDSVDLLCEQLQEDFRRLTAAKERTSVTVDIESTTLSDKASVIQCITNAIHAIKQSDHLKKLVVAAKQELRFSNTIAALQLAHHLIKSKQKVFRFIFRLANNAYFFGASPESLFSIRDGRLYSEAIAGTRARSSDKQRDKALEQELRQSSKDIHEHRYVHNMITSCLTSLSGQRIHKTEPEILKLEKLQHLLFNYDLPLENPLLLSDCIRLLHPTPAIVGLPKADSLAWISQHETHMDRGLYSGLVGWFSENENQSTVSIRSMLLKEQHLHVFAGAGVLAGSDAESEWEEIQLKLASILSALSSLSPLSSRELSRS